MLTADANRLKGYIRNGMRYEDGSDVLDKDKIDIIKMFNSHMPRIESEKIQDDGEIKRFSHLDLSISNEQILKIIKEKRLM